MRAPYDSRRAVRVTSKADRESLRGRTPARAVHEARARLISTQRSSVAAARPVSTASAARA